MDEGLPHLHKENNQLRVDLAVAKESLKRLAGEMRTMQSAQVREAEKLRLALENIRMYVLTRRNVLPKDAADALLRYCAEVGVTGTVLRKDAP